MSTFIKLTAVTREGRPFAKEILVDVNKIVEPIIENANNQSIIVLDEDNYYSNEYFGNHVKFVVSQRMSSIDLLTNEVFAGTIVTKNGKASEIASALFVKSKVVGPVCPVALGSEFGYRVMASKSPDLYVVSQSLNTINA